MWKNHGEMQRQRNDAQRRRVDEQPAKVTEKRAGATTATTTTTNSATYRCGQSGRGIGSPGTDDLDNDNARSRAVHRRVSKPSCESRRKGDWYPQFEKSLLQR